MIWWYGLGVVVLAILIIFQPEIRGLVFRMGYPWTVRFLPRTPRSEVTDEIVDAVDRLSQSRYGAIIVIAQETPLDGYIESGTEIQANVSADLLITLFTPYTPLHDGAVVIRDVVLVAAGCILPLSPAVFTDRMIGTRHRAAIGLSEQTDALVVVVSEENASVSVAHRGQLYRSLSTMALRDILNGEMPHTIRDHALADSSV